MSFEKELSNKVSIVNKWIDEVAPKGNGYQSEIFTAADYSLQAGGKRIRPVLSLAVCEMLGGNVEKLKHLACAIEFIHTYSLIHDDLPCMDNDDLRRGLPTNHIKFGEALALLAGDTLLNYAFETVAKADLPPDKVVKALSIIGTASGANGMIGGQVIDIKGAENLDVLLQMHKMKTGALIKASSEIGALVGEATEEERQSILKYSENLGIAFQIKDDILDVEGNEEILGKPIGSDKDSDKFTFVGAFGLQGSKIKLNEYTFNAKASLSEFGNRADFLNSLADFLLKREK